LPAPSCDEPLAEPSRAVADAAPRTVREVSHVIIEQRNTVHWRKNKTMGPLGWEETVFIFVLALLLFGPKKLPELGRTLGKAMTEFRRASTELKSSFDREMRSLEQETQSLKEATKEYQYDTHNYDYASYETNYEGSYGYDSDSTAGTTTESASATQDAESSSVAPPEGTIAQGEEAAAIYESGETAEAAPQPDDSEQVSSTTEKHA
jgi:sec-independent protein translocase protein TatA